MHLASKVASELRIEKDQLKINCNSMSAIYLVKNRVYHAQMKYIDVRFHFLERFSKKVI